MIRRLKNLLFEFVRQADHLNDIYAETANTIRMIAFREPATEKFKIFFAVQRIGTARTVPVDNGSRGGLVANIDLATGTLSEARSLHALDVHEVHPDSGKPKKKTLLLAMRELGVTPSETAMLGDQLLTDAYRISKSSLPSLIV